MGTLLRQEILGCRLKERGLVHVCTISNYVVNVHLLGFISRLMFKVMGEISEIFTTNKLVYVRSRANKLTRAK